MRRDGDRVRLGKRIGPRGRNVLHVGAWSLAAKVAAAANLFVPIPFVREALGPGQFGAWMTLVSLVALAGFLDLGFSNGAMNLVTGAHARGDERAMRTVFDEALRLLCQVAAIAAVPLLAVWAFVPWSRLLGLPAQDDAQAAWAAAAVLGAIVVLIPLNLGFRMRVGLREGHAAFGWQALGHLVALGGAVMLARRSAGLAALTAMALAPAVLVAAANMASLAMRAPRTRPAATRDLQVRRLVRQEGTLFFGLQLAAAFAFAADLVLISALQSARDAGEYGVVQRLFSIIPLGLSLVWVPLWPQYRHALARGDRAWARTTLRRSMLGAVVLAAIAAILLVFLHRPLLGVWLGAPIVPAIVLVAGFAAWAVVDAAGTAVATFLNAASVLAFQLRLALAFALACVATKVVLLLQGHVALLPWATLATYLAFSLLPFAWQSRRILDDVFSREY